MTKNKIQNLRNLMEKHSIQAYLVPSTDPHQSEYVPELWERRKWLSGFTGSAGDLAFTLTKSGLWTDSRYFLQAEGQLTGSGINLFKMGLPETPSIQTWLKNELNSGDKVGFDPRLFSYNEIKEMKHFFDKWKIELKSIETNLVDEIWEDQPGYSEEPIIPLKLEYSGESIESKLKRLRSKMADENCAIHVLTMLDAIAWLFNIRGTDVEFNPVVISYALITDKKAMFFTNLNKVSNELKNHFENDVEIYAYDEFKKQLSDELENDGKIWLDGGSISQWVVDIIGDKKEILSQNSPVTMFKAVKNSTEAEGMRNAHKRDGIALVKFLHWLENTIGKEKITELSAAEKLKKFREELDGFKGLSFNTITSYGEHGAIVHYESTPETDVELKPEGIYLIDSGGQFADGTTDTTRTVSLGNITSEQKKHFTLVLKGMMNLSMTSFPQGTSGKQLDTIARLPLWESGLNFAHGVGHGIGHYLNVHEGPQAISYYRCTGVAFEPGMISSNEPALYIEGEYGIRTENTILTIEDKENSSEEFTFYKFETLTLCPISLNLIEVSLLTEKERNFLNEYHGRVKKELLPFLNEDEKKWLIKATKAI